MKRPTPLDAPREFRIEEMFFSTTDRQGRILSGNDVFVRVSGYERPMLIGQPHNIIRHPDMPRAVFRLVWDFLGRGEPVAGLVKNLASDGRYYWVLAFLMPVDGGYLSIRFKPSGPCLPVIEALYRQMGDAERDQESRGADRATAMAAAEQVLVGALRARGHDGYEAFMRTLLHDELKQRDARLADDGRRLFPAALPGRPGAEGGRGILEVIYAESLRAYGEINRLYGQLDELGALNEELGARADVVLQQTRDFRFIAFNAALRAARLGEEARSLGVIADYLGEAAGRTTMLVSTLSGRIGAITGKLRAVIFNLAAARLQIEMLLSFCAELALRLEIEDRSSSGVPAEVRRMMIEDLQKAFSGTINRAVGTLMELDAELFSLGTSSEELRKTVLTLQVAQVGGLVESTRLKDDDSFVVMFADLRTGIECTKRALVELDETSGRLQAVAQATPLLAAVITSAVEQMSRDVHRLSAISTASPSPPKRVKRIPAAAELTAA